MDGGEQRVRTLGECSVFFFRSRFFLPFHASSPQRVSFPDRPASASLTFNCVHCVTLTAFFFFFFLLAFSFRVSNAPRWRFAPETIFSPLPPSSSPHIHSTLQSLFAGMRVSSRIVSHARLHFMTVTARGTARVAAGAAGPLEQSEGTARSKQARGTSGGRTKRALNGGGATEMGGKRETPLKLEGILNAKTFET